MSFVNDWYRDTIETDSQGRSRGMGITAALLKPFVDEGTIESGEQQAAVRSAIVRRGEDPAEYNLGNDATVVDAQGAVSRTIRQREKTNKEADRTNAISDALKLQAPQNRRLEQQQRESTNARIEGNQILREQGNDKMTLAIMQMQDSAATRRDDLLFRKEEARREDQRYNERMDQLDRKDRKALMQNMAMGIASLGAAFAL